MQHAVITREALEEKNVVIYKCPHSGEEFRGGDYYFLLSKNGVITNHVIDKKIIYTNKECRFHKEEDALKWNTDKFAKKPVFTFEGHDYFEGYAGYWFSKYFYLIREITISTTTSIKEGGASSKIYPSEELCKEALHNWIWENHKCTGKEMTEIEILWDNYELINSVFLKIFIANK